MKNFALLIVLIASAANSQELKKNPDTGKLEYIEIVNEARDAASFKQRLAELGYKNVKVAESSVTGESTMNEQTKDNPKPLDVEIPYELKIELKEGKYRITINNTQIKDAKGKALLEDTGLYQKKWIGRINERLPQLVSKIKQKPTTSEW